MSKLTFFIAVLTIAFSGSVHGEDDIDFSRDIRPILSDKCFACHGPEEAHREGGFRFDRQDSAFGEADSGEHPIVPGHPEESELVSRITSDFDGIQMPPKETNKPLTKHEIGLLTRWIEQGADWEDHWAFNPPTLPVPPMTSELEWGENEIDQFVLARLKKEKLSPSPEADRTTLIRRVTFDLTGLPPTPEEVRNFLSDQRPDAYEILVDRLLASKRFGEHVGRYWLDAARYGDTHGLHLDNYREMWLYRDWVIDAFNQNKPFDQFLVEQLAGDLLPHPTDDQLIATGFNRAHVTTNEGGSIAEEVHVRNVVDRVVTFGTVFMGTTLECTRCHDHKFDPLTMNDFYSLYAYFNSMDGNPLDGNKKDPAPILKVPSDEQQEQLQNFANEIAELEEKLNGRWPQVTKAQRQWEKEIVHEASEEKVHWNVFTPQQFTSQGGAKLTLRDDDSILASGPNPDQEVYEIVGQIDGPGWQGIRLEGLLDPSLTNEGAGRSPNSNVVLSGFEVFTAAIPQGEDAPDWKEVKIVKASADYEQENGDFKIGNAIDADPKSGWAIGGHVKKEPRVAKFQTRRPFGSKDPSLVKIVLKHQSPYPQHQFGRFRLSLSKQNPIRVDGPPAILAIAKVKPKDRNEKQKANIRKHYREQVTSNEEYVQVRDELAARKKAREEFDNTLPTTLIWKEKTTPETAHILNRGEYDQPGEAVSRRTPSFLPPMDSELPNDRLGLARWLIDRDHPLTARVTVNRFWQQFFGTGLVKTSEDFGSQGEPPSHPQLLDWLAVQFMHDNWNIKQTMKRIVLSSTYCQSSNVTPQLIAKDPKNRLLARGPRFRLDAEMLRDQALFVGDLLIETMGGPSVKPPQPDGLWFAVGYSGSNTVRFKPDEGPEKVHRRTVYTFIKRTAPPPQMNIFDAPSRESCTVRRERTNTPMQALLLFNDPQYVETAIALAARSIEDGQGNAESVAKEMLWRTLTRKPSKQEVNALVRGVAEDQEWYRSHPEEAKKLLQIGADVTDENFDAARLAAWTMAANLVLNLDEVVTKN